MREFIDRAEGGAMLPLMKGKQMAWAVIILIILGVAGWYFTKKNIPAGSQSPSVHVTTEESVYPYECDEHVMVNMAMSSGGETIVIGAAHSSDYPPATTLHRVAATSGARYEGGGFIFTARGESVSITEDGHTLNCSPVPNPDSAPFNFGD